MAAEKGYAQPGECLVGGCNTGVSWGATQNTTSSTYVASVGGTWGGEYNIYNVVNGNQYEWSLCTADGAINPSADMTMTLTNGVSNVLICYSDDRCGAQPKILWTANFTGTVRVYIHEYPCAANTNSHTVVWRCVSCAGPVAPTNDLVCNATAIVCGQTLAGTTVNATLNGTGEGVACGGTATQPGVWYTVSGTGAAMTAALCGTVWDSRIQVFSGNSCNAITCLGGNDDNGPACAGSSASYSWNSVLGTNYYIFVSGFSSSSAFSISLNCAGPPANDLICNATPVSCGQTINGTTINATLNGTAEGVSCGAFTPSQPGVWYSIIGNGSSVSASLCGSGWNSRIQVFTGANCSAVNCVGGNDDNGPLCAGNAASYSWPTTNGQTYYIFISGANNTNTFTLSMACQTPCAVSCGGNPPPSNDACGGATNLGIIPIPPQCINETGGIGTIATFNLNNLCATAEPNYTSLLGCTPSGNQATPAADVWYRFTLTAPVLNITLNGLGTPNLALYEGINCAALIPRGCAIGSTGSLNTQFQGLAPGTYFLQVSGGDVLDRCNFTLTLQNNFDCSGCVLAAALDATPPPINGQYQPGTQVNFCYSITSYQQTSANWLHGVVPTFGPGWDMSTFTPLATTTTNGLTPNSCNAGGNWSWYNTNVTSSATGSVFGPGFYFETAAGSFNGIIDGNPGNNYGDANPGGCTWNFCWSIRTKPIEQCIQDQSLNVTINTTGDGESGSWTSLACNLDPQLTFFAQSNCCPQPSITVVNATCISSSNGSATAQGLGSSPWTYIWKNAAGVVLQTNANIAGSSIINNLPPGDYILQVTDAASCTSYAAFTIIAPAPPNATFTTPQSTICSGSTGVIDFVGTPNSIVAYSVNGGATQFINLSAAGTASLTTPALSSNTTFTLINISTGGSTPCVNALTGSILFTITPAPSATLSYGAPSFCNNVPGIINPTVSGTLGGSFSATPAGLTLNNVTGAITPSTSVAGIYTISYFIPSTGGCPSFSTNRVITIKPVPIASTPLGAYSICSGATLADASSFTINLNSNLAGTTFTWIGTDGSSGSSSPIGYPVPNNTCTDQTITYTITPSLNGCTGTPINRVLTIRPKPTSSFTLNPNPVCSNSNATVTYTGTSCPGSTYNWTWPAGVSIVSGSGSGPYSISFTGAGPFNIQLQVVGPASLGSCTGSAVNQIISLEPSVTPIFNYINQTYCKDAVITQPILLQTSVNGITGTWSPAAISTSNLGTTTYTFTPNSGQCANTTSFTVSINNLPSTDGIYHD